MCLQKFKDFLHIVILLLNWQIQLNVKFFQHYWTELKFLAFIYDFVKVALQQIEHLVALLLCFKQKFHFFVINKKLITAFDDHIVVFL